MASVPLIFPNLQTIGPRQSIAISRACLTILTHRYLNARCFAKCKRGALTAEAQRRREMQNAFVEEVFMEARHSGMRGRRSAFALRRGRRRAVAFHRR